MDKKLKFTAFSGIIYLISFFPEIIFGLLLEEQPMNNTITNLLLITYFICILSTIFFYYGYIILGKNLKNDLLTVSSWIIILTAIFYYSYQMYTINYPKLEPDIVDIGSLFIFGFSVIIFGIGLIRTNQLYGTVATIAGILDIIVGFFFITVILFLFGFILSIPAIILEILVLLKAAENFLDNLDTVLNSSNDKLNH